MDADVPMDEVRGDLPLDTSILPIFTQYKQENASWIENFGIWDYLNLRADFDLAAAFSKLFWPDFIEVEGCVLLKYQYSPDNFKDWMIRFRGDGQAVEAMINHAHLSDRFLNSPRNVEYPDELYQYLMRALMFGWKSALQEAFPGKQFIFTVRHNDFGHELSFHQASNGYIPVNP